MTAPTPTPTAPSVTLLAPPVLDPPGPRHQAGEPVTEPESSGIAGMVSPELPAIPEAAFLLLAVGMLALNIWIAHPHLVRAAATAAILLTGGLLAAVATPTSSAAWYFLALAAASFMLEVLILPGMLLHAAGGAFALVLAGLSLREPWTGAHPVLVIPIAAFVGAGTAYAARWSWRYTRADPFDSSSRLIGREAIVLTAHSTFGQAVIAGALWGIYSRSPLQPGDTVTVTAQHGEILLVKPLIRRHNSAP